MTDTSSSAAPAIGTADAPSHELRKTTSTGTWGEAQSGEGVDIDRARADFELARQNSRHSLRGGRPLSVSRSRGDRIEEIANAEKSGGGGDDDESPFNLSDWIQTRMAQEAREGKHSHKPLGLAWRDLTVSVPGGAGSAVFVKTLPRALLNTLTRDPVAILSMLVPPFGKLLSKRVKGETHLLQGHSGLVRSGEMCLVLGKPGSGCTTLLKALMASSDPNLKVTHSTLDYAGLSAEQIQRNFRGEVIFLSEEDTHWPTLTVEQTLAFALRNKVPHSAGRLQNEARSSFIETAIDVILRMFAMEHVRGTIVGDAGVRGVSGGERKRVTISEALITRASMQAHDNSTRGLDASTALEYARSLRILTDLTGRTTFATLYQVSESIYDLFDKVAVIDEGRLVFFGPRATARQYFSDLGYFCPERMTTADFVVGVCDPNQVRFREGWEKRAPRTAVERQQAWESSELHRELLQDISAFEQEHRDEKGRADNLAQVVAREKNKGVSHTSPYTVSFWEQVKACVVRQALIKWGDRESLYIKFGTILTVSLVISAIFYGQSADSSGAFTKGGLMLFATLFNGWLQLSEAFEAVGGRPIIQRQRVFAFCRPSAVVIARALVDIPLLIAQTLLSSIIFYFLGSLRVDAGAFFIFWVYVLLSAYNLTALYRMIASLSPTFNEAIRFAVLSLNIIIIFVGYVIRRPQMNWLIWLSYVQGISYAFAGLLANEFNYQIPCSPMSIIPFGAERDARYQTCGLSGQRPGSLVVESRDYLGVTFGYSRREVAYNWAVVIAFTVIYMGITLVASEAINWGGSGGGLMVFAKTKRAKEQLKSDEASPASDVEAAAAPARTDSGSDSTRANSATDVGGKGDASVNMDDRSIFTWNDMNLELASGRKLLQHVDGFCKPGTCTALMGASGAGKTTLMSVLSQRGVAGAVTGEMLVDGKPLDIGFQKGTGLVLQGDLHPATQTVREAIEFSALLRQPASVSKEEKLAYAQEVMELLELVPIQDALIGVPGAGLGVEKRKRVSIGVELAAKPELLLFLDEPTSGLDSEGAANVIRLLRRLAEQGQAILCTIHQPSALLFESFDNMLLLRPGGQTTYFGQIGEKRGQGSERVRDYFERMGAPKCSPDQNVAEWMLEVVSGSLGRGIDWAKRWSDSEEAQAVRDEIAAMNKDRAQRPPRIDPKAITEYSAPFSVQFTELAKRTAKDFWRDSSFTYSLILSYFLTGLASGAAFAKLPYTPTTLQIIVFIPLLILLAMPALINSILSKHFESRLLYAAREGPAKIYTWYAMLTSFLIVTAPLSLIGALVFFPTSLYIPLGKQSAFVSGFYFLNCLTVSLYFIQFSLLLAAPVANPIQASNLLPLLLPILFTASGIIIPRPQMPAPFRYVVYWANPITYYLKATVATLLEPITVTCSEQDLYNFTPPPGQSCQVYAGDWAQQAGGYLQDPNATDSCSFCQFRTGSQFAQTLQADYDFVWQAWGILLAFTIGNIALVLALYWLVQVKGFSLGLGPVKAKISGLFARKTPAEKVNDEADV